MTNNSSLLTAYLYKIFPSVRPRDLDPAFVTIVHFPLGFGDRQFLLILILATV